MQPNKLQIQNESALDDDKKAPDSAGLKSKKKDSPSKTAGASRLSAIRSVSYEPSVLAKNKADVSIESEMDSHRAR